MLKLKKVVPFILTASVAISAIAFIAGCSSGSSDNAGSETVAEAPVQETETQDAKNESDEAQEEQTVPPVDPKKVYVSAEWVKSVLDGENVTDKQTIILHGGWGEASEDFLAKHIPEAVHLNTDMIEEDENWNIRTPKEIESVLLNLGITKDTNLIVYGEDSGAARVAFVAFWAGVSEVHLLDGGLAAWEASGFETSSTPAEPSPAKDFGTTIPANPQYLLSMPEDVIPLQQDENFRLVSIRSWEEFIGETSGYSYIDKAGEPMGAVWGHDEFDYVDDDGKIKPFNEIEAMWDEWDIHKENTVSFYCGTGWRACIPFFIAYENGWENISLYDGGWFVWQKDDSLPVQTGDPREQ